MLRVNMFTKQIVVTEISLSGRNLNESKKKKAFCRFVNKGLIYVDISGLFRQVRIQRTQSGVDRNNWSDAPGPVPIEYHRVLIAEKL